MTRCSSTSSQAAGCRTCTLSPARQQSICSSTSAKVPAAMTAADEKYDDDVEMLDAFDHEELISMLADVLQGGCD